GTYLKWVAAEPREGHAEACTRYSLNPTSREVFIQDEVWGSVDFSLVTYKTPRGGLVGAKPDLALSSLSLGVTTEGSLASWSLDLLSLVADGLGLGLQRPEGIAGCCVPGMWCSSTDCMTLAFGDSFSNHGGYVGMPKDSFSVYTCSESVPSVPLRNETRNSTGAAGVHSRMMAEEFGNKEEANDEQNSDPSAGLQSSEGDGGEFIIIPLDPPLPTPVIDYDGVVSPGERLTLVGSNFGTDRKLSRVMVGGRECMNPELCNRVCRPCSEDQRCDFDEMCVEDGISKAKV
ncbi:unnamed protein product, partial [Choristocarpus tenellus]